MAISIASLLETSKCRRISCITCYTANIAAVIDGVVDVVLVGDSVGMVLYGEPNTHNVTMEMMISHASAVRKQISRSLLVFDMPFGSYEESPEFAFRNALLAIKKTGCDAIKLEGGTEMCDTIKFLCDRGIPVIGHVGLMPQKYKLSGSFKKITDFDKVLHDFDSVSKSGVFSIVVENVTDSISKQINTQYPDVLTIGIGAGNFCKGEIVVLEDLCGLSGKNPPFCKPKSNLLEQIEKIVAEYSAGVKG